MPTAEQLDSLERAGLPSSAALLDLSLPGPHSASLYPSPPAAQVGSVLIQEGVLLPDGFQLESDRYTVGWQAVRTMNGFGVDRKIRSAGWNMFTIAGEIKATVWGSTADRLRLAVIRVLAMVRARRFNTAEVTAIAPRHFLGIPYTSVTVQARHIQQSYLLDGERLRAQIQQDTDWARS